MWKRLALALVLLLAALGLWQHEALRRLHAVNTLFAEDRIVANFSAMTTLFESVEIPVSGRPTPLPEGPAFTPPAEWQAWLDRRAVTGIVILQDGRIVHESYHKGTARDDPRISWSVAKSYLSALFGVLLEHGAIQSLDDPVTRYAPSLAGGAYDGATIRNVLQMASGVEFDEDYHDFWSDINKMGRILALGGSMDGFAESLDERVSEPGRDWAYVSIDTHVLGMVLRGATGRSVADLLGEHILTPLGTYGTPSYLTDGYGVAFVLGGLTLTTRDYARMGEMFRNEGAFQGRQIVPRDWAIESTRASAPTKPGQIGYGYQWWIPVGARDGAFLARGIYGQFVYVDRQAGVVVAVNGADRDFREPGAFDDSMQMFRRIAASYEESP